MKDSELIAFLKDTLEVIQRMESRIEALEGRKVYAVVMTPYSEVRLRSAVVEAFLANSENSATKALFTQSVQAISKVYYMAGDKLKDV
jgi:hypothetical protein